MKREKRKNPLIAFVIDEEEFKKLKIHSATYGVSIAQIARGYFRTGVAKTSVIPAIKWGKIAESELTV